MNYFEFQSSDDDFNIQCYAIKPEDIMGQFEQASKYFSNNEENDAIISYDKKGVNWIKIGEDIFRPNKEKEKEKEKDDGNMLFKAKGQMYGK